MIRGIQRSAISSQRLVSSETRTQKRARHGDLAQHNLAVSYQQSAVSKLRDTHTEKGEARDLAQHNLAVSYQQSAVSKLRDKGIEKGEARDLAQYNLAERKNFGYFIIRLP